MPIWSSTAQGNSKHIDYVFEHEKDNSVCEKDNNREMDHLSILFSIHTRKLMTFSADLVGSIVCDINKTKDYFADRDDLFVSYSRHSQSNFSI